MAVCLTAGALTVVIPASAFVLSWTHSVERTVWREDWRAVGDTLVLEEAAVQGSGAGMEPGADAHFDNGAWRYRPSLPPLHILRLAHSEYADDYRLCWRDKCEQLANLAARGQAEALEIRPCEPPDHADDAAEPPEPAPARAYVREEKP
ncbi:MAG: DUF1850 domain-containing protein [Rhodospirillales bacterium]|nr:DUF1850 domain-containing protein [Rhodospirillales bacterium]